VAIVGYGLVHHYNHRMTHAREAAWFIESDIEKVSGFSVRDCAYQSKEKPSGRYDSQELLWFGLIILLSVFPTLSLVIWKFFVFQQD
jgi:hypothetical protein